MERRTLRVIIQQWIIIVLAIAGVLVGVGKLIGKVVEIDEVKAQCTSNTLNITTVLAHFSDLKERLIRIEDKLDKQK